MTVKGVSYLVQGEISGVNFSSISDNDQKDGLRMDQAVADGRKTEK